MNSILDKDIESYTAFLETERFKLKQALPINEAKHILLIHKYEKILEGMVELKQIFARTNEVQS
jgi:hypothetical protein